MSASFPQVSRNFASNTIQEVYFEKKLLVRYPKPSFSKGSVTVSKSSVKQVTETTTSFISLPWAPAFILIAPPTVPGIPLANSKPERDFPSAIVAISAKVLPTPTISSVSKTSILRISGFTTIPRIPLSLTNKFVPFPITVTEMFFSFAN